MGRKGYYILILTVLLGGCKKDKPASITNTTTSITSGVYVVCEGVFNGGNATLYLYHPAEGRLFGDLYKAQNGYAMGDVFQSMVKIDGNYFLAVNNSQRVEVIRTDNFAHIASVSIPYPRYILPLGNNRALVSSLYRNKVYEINTATFALTDSIVLPFSNTEGMCLVDHAAFVCTWDTAGSYIYQVDINTKIVTKAIRVAGRAPHDILIDREQKIWVLAGNTPKNKTSTWTRLDPSTGDILASYNFPAGAEPIKPVLNPTKDTLYFIEANYAGGADNNGIYRMSIHSTSLPAVPFLQAQHFQYFWGLGIDPSDGRIYIGDPKGFNQNGSVMVMQPDGTNVTSFDVGVGPGQFYFEE